jgi:hypothetical protein
MPHLLLDVRKLALFAVRSTLIAGIILVTLGAPSRAEAATITVFVNAEGDLWLAGMPAGTTDLTDVAPTNSPTQAVLSFDAGDVLTFSLTGLADHCAGFGCGATGPEGEATATNRLLGPTYGISDITAPFDSLVGVFLGPNQPSLSSAPAALSFAAAASRDFTTLTPLLQQSFFIGNGLRNDGLTVQTFVVPTGGTRLFLGVMDAYGWEGNSGGFTATVNNTSDVVVTPEPGSMLLVLTGLAGMCVRRGGRRSRADRSSAGDRRR